jgi:Domain of unknown function (DUF427)
VPITGTTSGYWSIRVGETVHPGLAWAYDFPTRRLLPIAGLVATFWIFDTFGSDDARQAHINGEIAAALMANADKLLAAPPEILAADVLAAK